MSRAVVVGGGITGLTTALTLAGRDVEVDVFEAGSRVGGKVLTTEVRGAPVDAGADAFLVREAHMTELCEELELAPDLVPPATGKAWLWLDGALRPLPQRQFLGVPLDLDDPAVIGVLSAAGVARAARDLDAPADGPSGDESVGSLVRRRLGDEVMDRLVGPLLGGINAGDGDRLSLHAGVPQLAAAAAHDPSLIRSIRAHLRGTDRDPSAPIFRTHPNGLGQVVDALATRLGPRVRLDEPVNRIERAGPGWRVHARSVTEADAVVITSPAFASASILREVAPRAAALLEDIDYASVVMVTFAFATREIDPLDGSGFLIPRSEGLTMTACSWASAKWAHLAAGPTAYLRVSAGHAGDEAPLTMPDGELVDALRRELAWTAGVTAEPREVRITRWPRSFPQYRPGHLERVAAIDASLAEEAPGVTVAGAAYRGLGLPACVHQARRAAAWVTDHLGASL